MKKIFYLLTVLVILVAGCKKADFSNNTVTGEGLVDFTLKTPVSSTVIELNAATPATPISFSWNAAKPGLETAAKYKVVFALKTGGDLNSPLIQFDADNSGAATTVSLTYKQMDDALKGKGIADGAKTELIWSVLADNGDKQLLSQNIFTLTITRFKDGASPFLLLGPVSSVTSQSINPNSTSDIFTFNWTKSRPATGGPAVKYKVLFAERKLDVNGVELPINWKAPLFSIGADNNGVDSFAKVSYKALSDSVSKYGFSNLLVPVPLKWTVVATSGTWNQLSDYANSLIILREINFYLVGSINGWDINNLLQMVLDQKADRYGKVFYSYIKLVAGDEFKFVKTPGDWGSAYGDNGAGATPGSFNTGFNVGNNFKALTDGIYRLTIDLSTNIAYVQQKAVGVVGNMQGWDPPGVLHGAYITRDKFLIVAPSSGSDGFKLHDGTEWDNSTPGKSRWWGKGSADGLLDTDGNGADLIAAFTPRTRVIWDGTDVQKVKYEMNSAVEMRIVGDGINQAGVNDWDPPSSPQMTYAGNGKWTITIALKGGKDFKFVAGNAWGAFDYEDNSGQSNTVGTPRPIKYDGSNNFKTPAAAGTYTVTLDEHAQTVTIN